MIKYIMSLRRSSRSWLDPLPMDFGTMYYIYPADMEGAKANQTGGLCKKLVNRFSGWIRRKEDETLAFRPEKIY